jgi:hypothetical protein
MKLGTVLLTSFTLMCAGCCSAPAISTFTVTPSVLCEGERAVVNWEANSQPVLAIQEDQSEAGAGECVASGRSTFALTLAVGSGNDEKEQRVEFVQLAAIASEPIAFKTDTVEGDVVVARGEKNPALWDERVEVATIEACRRTPLTVKHAGRSMTIKAGNEKSEDLAGTPISGSWELRSPLTNQEIQTPRLRPKELTILATLRCRK